jgi:zinc protease
VEDWAGGGIALDSLEVVAERGVVLGEWRGLLVDTASQRIRARLDTVLFGGSAYVSRFPIGLPERLRTAHPAPLRRFYRDWYRPDLMAIVAVGDFDPKEIEREIRARFGQLPAPRRARPRVAPDLGVSQEMQVDVLRDKVLPGVEVLWPAQRRAAEPRAALRQELVAELLLGNVQRALLRIRQRPSRPFIHAEVSRGRIVRPLDVVSVQAVAWPDSLERALGAVLAEVERIARGGVPPALLEGQKAALLRRLEGQAASVAARSSSAYAERYVEDFLSGELLLSAEQELALARALLPEITSETLADAARSWRDAKGRRVIVYVPELAHVRPPTRESVVALFDSVRRAPLALDTAPPSAAGPLMRRLPAPGAIVAETLHAGAGITAWTLSNGARVLFKPSQNHPDELLVRAWSPGGFSLLPDSLFFGSGRMAARLMTEAAGLGELGHDDLRQRLATTGVRELRVDIGYADESIELEGSPRELELLFQALHLQFTAPKLDTAALAAWAHVAKYQAPITTIDDGLNQLFARGNPRLLPVTTHLAELARLDDVLAVYRHRFGNAGDFTFMVVGAATSEQVRPLVARYLASLPATGARETPKDPEIRPVVGRNRQRLGVLPVPRSETLLAFDGPFPTEPAAYLAERQRLSALALVLERRLRERLREALGGTYGVGVFPYTYRLYDEHFRVLVGFHSEPARMRELTREMFTIIDSLRTSGATVAELARAALIQRRRLETQLQSNRFWLERIALYHRLSIPLDRIVSPYSAEPVTPEEAEAAARKYLPEAAYLHVIAEPSDSTMHGSEPDSLSR